MHKGSSLERICRSGWPVLAWDQHHHAIQILYRQRGRIALAGGTYREEDPLQGLTVIVRFLVLVEAKLIFLVVPLLQIEKDRCRLEHNEVVALAINQNRDTSVGIQLDKPVLLLDILGDVNVFQPEAVTVALSIVQGYHDAISTYS